jgi:Zinc finger, C3HC4 type (RING finger)
MFAFTNCMQWVSQVYAPLSYSSNILIWGLNVGTWAVMTLLQAYFLIWGVAGTMVLLGLLRRVSNSIRNRWRTQAPIPAKRDRSPQREVPKAAENEEDECLACRENEKTYLCTPCGHLSLCGNCKSLVTSRCPVCNCKFDAWVRLYK